MNRQIIANTTCAFCNKPFDIATEDLHWEHMSDCGETDENPKLKDFSISQKIRCSNCGRNNDVMITVKGENEANLDLDSIKVINFSEIQNSIDS